MRAYQIATATALLAATCPSFAQGTPPADVGQSVTAATATGKAPEAQKPDTDVLNLALAAGAQIATGNSRMFAASGQIKFDIRRGSSAFAASVVGNYADGFVAAPAPGKWQETTENVQAKLRYDIFFMRNFSGFLQFTGTHDAFQAITFRLNVDPGVKYLFIDNERTKLWGELGYDFQFDLNYTDAFGYEQQGGGGGRVVDANMLPYVINESDTIHSTRAFAGFQHAFNKQTQIFLGLEYLQALGGAPGGLPVLPPGQTDMTVDRVAIPLTPARLNFDALFTAKVGAGFSVGIGFLLRYNSDPLPGKENVDTTTTLTLIYSVSDKKVK